MSKPKRPRIDDLPRLEIVPTQPQKPKRPDTEQTVLDNAELVWVWQKPAKRSKYLN